jgi:hypothetical protein
MIRIGNFENGLTDSIAVSEDNLSRLPVWQFMTSPITAITPRQAGALRIEIAAIIMLLAALAMVLVTNVLPKHQAGIAQTGEQVQILPAAAGSESDAP